MSRLFVCNFVVLWALSTALEFLNDGETAPFYDYYQERVKSLFLSCCVIFSPDETRLKSAAAAAAGCVFLRYNVLDLRFSSVSLLDIHLLLEAKTCKDFLH